MRLLFLGPPGAGKGTQAKLISEQYALKHLSSGDILRAEVAAGTTLGTEAKGYMNRGALVSDATVVAIMVERIKQVADNFILDGFPRTVPQAEALDEALKEAGVPLHVAICIEVEREKLMDRLTGRLTCLSCGQVYHRQDDPPPGNGRCVDCGSEKIIQRDDDNEQVVGERLANYQKQTAPLIDYYRRSGLLECIDGSLNRDAVTTALRATVESIDRR